MLMSKSFSEKAQEGFNIDLRLAFLYNNIFIGA
jgi:hypothetical protein